jgi:hypothetical protein
MNGNPPLGYGAALPARRLARCHSGANSCRVPSAAAQVAAGEPTSVARLVEI